VASAKRASAVSAELRARGVDEEGLARIRSPAGLDLGPSTQEEIGVAVLAELVAWRHLHRASDEVAVPETAIDPVCGMTVAVATAAHVLQHEGTTHYFCGPGCLRKFQAALV
jgi:xanthine dehydrogenase accessory factor